MTHPELSCVWSRHGDNISDLLPQTASACRRINKLTKNCFFLVMFWLLFTLIPQMISWKLCSVSFWLNAVSNLTGFSLLFAITRNQVCESVFHSCVFIESSGHSEMLWICTLGSVRGQRSETPGQYADNGGLDEPQECQNISGDKYGDV